MRPLPSWLKDIVDKFKLYMALKVRKTASSCVVQTALTLLKSSVPNVENAKPQ